MPFKRDNAYYLRGLVVAIIVLNHYVDWHFSNNLTGYGFISLSLLFILSGYGIFHSLKKLDPHGGINLDNLGVFFLRRILRIFPIYWLSVAVYSLGFPQMYHLNGFLASLFMPFTFKAGIYWFMYCLIQCYLSAPLIYYLLSKMGSGAFFTLTCLYISAAKYSHLTVGQYPGAAYLSVPWGYIVLFACGMLIAKITSHNPLKAPNKSVFLSAIVLFSSLILRINNEHLPISVDYLDLLVMASSLLFCLCFLASPPSSLPLKVFLTPLGGYSYSIYLFHPAYFSLLSKTGLIKYGHASGFLLAVALFPILVLACVALESAYNKLAAKVLKMNGQSPKPNRN